jgi:hypothetical protein
MCDTRSLKADVFVPSLADAWYVQSVGSDLSNHRRTRTNGLLLNKALVEAKYAVGTCGLSSLAATNVEPNRADEDADALGSLPSWGATEWG